MNPREDIKLMEALTLDDLRDFNSIELDNKKLENNNIIENIPNSNTQEDKLIVLTNDSSNTADLNNKEFKYNTLNESVYETIVKYLINNLIKRRDVLNVLLKVKYVLNPFLNNEEKSKQLRNWDLWGPLVFTIMLSLTLSYGGKEKGSLFVLVFILIWFGSLIITLNGQLLGAKISIFQFICLLGYCMFPLNISAIVFKFILDFNDFLKLIIVILCCVWSTYSSIGFIKQQSVEEKKHLVLYPIILFYLFLSFFVLMNHN